MRWPAPHSARTEQQVSLIEYAGLFHFKMRLECQPQSLPGTPTPECNIRVVLSTGNLACLD